MIAHGQMDEDVLERQMMRFWDRDADVLVCTVIIESGLDVPNANTLVVDAGHLLGLAQMYQLRGRVGRSTERAFAYFFFPPSARADRGGPRAAHDDQPAPGARQRVPDRAARPGDPRRGQRPRRRAARPHRRGGVRHVRAAAAGVGRRDARRAAAGAEGDPDRPAGQGVRPAGVGGAGGAPARPLPPDRDRRGDHERLAEVRAETIDRYGRLPDEVETLFAVASLRLSCERLGVEEVTTYRQQVRIKPIALESSLEVDLGQRVAEATYHATTGTLNLLPDRVAGTDLPGWVEDRLLRARAPRSALLGWPGDPPPPSPARVRRARRPGRRGGLVLERRRGAGGERRGRGDLGRAAPGRHRGLQLPRRPLGRALRDAGRRRASRTPRALGSRSRTRSRRRSSRRTPPRTTSPSSRAR